MATMEEAQVERGYRRLSSLFRPTGLNFNKCHRCMETVYHNERIGPVHDVVFHRKCFKCYECGNYLTIKNYWGNQSESADHEIYCHAHAPRIGAARVDRTSIQIKRAMDVQSDYDRAANKLPSQMKVPGSVPGPQMDTRSVGIKGAMDAQKLTVPISERGHNPEITASALHIQGALHAQRLQKRYQRKLDKHHYPPHIMKKRRELIEAQKKLEEALRKDEDDMFRTFKRERKHEQEKLKDEINKEWEVRLKELTDKFERDNVKKKKRSPGDNKAMTLQFESAKKDLENHMTLKREKKKQTMTLRLKEKEQNMTSTLVKKQSEVMLELVAAKREEIRREVEKVLEQQAEEEKKLQEQQVLKQQAPTPAPPPPPKIQERSPQETAFEEELPLPPPPPINDISPVEEALAELGVGSGVNDVSPHAPRWRKTDIIPDETFFDALDEHVIQIAESEQSDYTELVEQLTENALTDVEKARAIYRWITVKDLNVMEFDDTVESDTPMGLLRGIKYGTETYHVLFMRLCSYAGIQCKEIKGHSKSVGYEPGMKFKPETFLNTWNAVLVDGDWRLIQCNWGARHLVLNKDQKKSRKKDQIRYQYDDHYFLTDPDEFVHEFWPFSEKWQLLDIPLTLEEFEALPFVRSVFFRYGMRFDGCKMAVLHCDDKGGADIKIKVPEELENDLIFFYQLRFAEKDRAHDSVYRGSNLERFVFQSMVDNTVMFSVHVPTQGEYFFEVFANKSLESTTTDEDGTNVTPFRLKCACKFKIICSEMNGKMHPLPNCASGEWGPKKAFRHFALTPIFPNVPDNSSDSGESVESQRAGVMNIEDSVELKFRVPRPLHFVAKLRMNNIEDQILDPFVNLSAEQDMLIIKVDLPQIGQYGLDVYARSKTATDKGTLSHACKFLLNCLKVSTPMELPKAEQSKQHWGATSTFEEMGMKTLSHKDPKIKLSSSNQCTIELHIPEGIELSYQFIREPDEDNREYVTMKKDNRDKTLVKFVIKVNQPGKYMLCLYGRYTIDDDRSMPNIYNYLITYTPPEAKSKRESIFNKTFQRMLNGEKH